MKTCSRCDAEKPLSEFYALKPGHGGRVNPGHFSECKACNSARASAWSKAKRADDPSFYRRSHLRSLYGITPEQFDSMLTEQNGKCAICGTTEPGGKGRFHVDHSHADKQVRALLCHGCNTGIGSLGDDPDRLMAAAAYLLSFQDVIGKVAF